MDPMVDHMLEAMQKLNYVPDAFKTGKVNKFADR